jgi:NAD(P)-dependent dehydrogenase (short-subunit alcohol dehydrogenase family)
MIGRREPRDLAGRVALVTGGARGIGAATAERLAAAGMRVAIGDKDADQVAATAAALGVLGARLDVTSRASWTLFLAEVAGLGPVDVLVNNAGIMPLGDLLKEPDEVTRRVVDVNLHGVVLGTKAVAPGMVDRGRGHVVNVASAVGRVPAPGGASYSASKHAVVGLTDAVRQELAAHGVAVTMVLPTVTRTELAQGVGNTPGIPPQTPADVARVIEEVLRRPVAEAWVPRWAQPIAKVGGALPRVVQDALARAFGADRVLVDVDGQARAGYEEDVRRTDGQE